MARPTKYNKEMLPIILEKFSSGASVCEICADIGICRETFYNWTEEYPEFLDTYKKGLSLSQAWWEKIGREGALGDKPINPTMWIFNMKNRFHQEWKDKHEVESHNDHKITIERKIINSKDD